MNADTKITDAQLDTFLDQHGMNFEVEMKPTFTLGTDDQQVETGGFVALRTDNNTPLGRGGLSQGFTPIQNRDAFKVISELSGVTDLEMKQGGMWGNGAGIYAQVSLGDFQVGNANTGDNVGKYLTVVNSHDGSKGMQILITPYRYFCKNQIAASIASANDNEKISIRHTASAHIRMEELIRTVSIADGAFQRTQEIYNTLANQKVNTEYAKEVLNQLFPAPSQERGRAKTLWENNIQSVWSRYTYADGGRIEQNTAWNLYNAVQGTMQHDSKNTANKDKSILMGSIAKRSADALSIVLDTCSSEHIPASVHAEIDALVG
jgi:phage/plasmid-like protein (TIGR03299 family)